jgi:hypothetical protein
VKHLKSCTFFTDNWNAFAEVLPPERHVIEKKHTVAIESAISHQLQLIKGALNMQPKTNNLQITNGSDHWSNGLNSQEHLRALRIRQSLADYYYSKTTPEDYKDKSGIAIIYLPRNSTIEEISKTEKLIQDAALPIKIITDYPEDYNDFQPGTPRVPDSSEYPLYTNTKEFKQLMLKIAKEAYNIDLLKELEPENP